jgi:lipopolysaccharide/colanic/teichoic acid biosynthesis glycosyltransferase
VPSSSAWYGPSKAIGEIALAVPLLILTAPLILLLMGLVKLTSRGPALYSQVRLGLHGRPYAIFKLRTMAYDCERLSGPRWSTAGDPRVTRLGRVLRACHLDELPQLWNVIRGEMSLVGPRPERPEFVPHLERAIPGYRGRLRVRPGITGLAQVQLPPDEEVSGVRRKVACDLCYIDRIGPWLDARIVAATAMKLIGVPASLRSQLLQLPGIEPDPPGPKVGMVEIASPLQAR